MWSSWIGTTPVCIFEGKINASQFLSYFAGYLKGTELCRIMTLHTSRNTKPFLVFIGFPLLSTLEMG